MACSGAGGMGEVAEWAQITLALMTVVGSVIGSVSMVSFRTGTRFTEIAGAIQANAKAISDLTRSVEERATIETAKGLQAQLTRQEGALATTMQELGSRIERHSARVDKVEEAHAARESANAAVLGRLEANMAGVKEAVDRLIAAESKHAAAPVQQPNMIDALRMLVDVLPLIKKMA